MKLKKFNEELEWSSTSTENDESSEKLEELKGIVKKFNKEKDLEKKYKLTRELLNFSQENNNIKGVDDEKLWNTIGIYYEHIGSFATAIIHTNEIDDGIEMVDMGYLFDNIGFEPFQG